jgi:tetratricopeptide (TPR) repeat protein
MAGAFIWCGWKLYELKCYGRAMAEIKREIQAGRHGHALRLLEGLSAWKLESDEADYLLGVCENARGQSRAAFQAWERVPAGSPFAARAIRARVEQLIERGRLADAEELITKALNDPRTQGSALRLFLGLVCSMQGRTEEGQRWIETCWNRLNEAGDGGSDQAILLVRLHIQLRREVPAVESVRSLLDRAARSSPDDDRVWLGKARLALRVGSYDEAVRWLDACQRRRPDDVPVWRARLDWALATQRVTAVRLALAHLPVEQSTPAQVQRFAAWLAAHGRDGASERRALERLTAVDPTDFAALDRLVAIADKPNEADRAGELRCKKAEVDRLLARYELLVKRNQTMRDAAEMASVAARLGLQFEARVFLTIAIATDPDNRALRDELAVIKRNLSATSLPAGSLADLLAKESDATDSATTRPSVGSSRRD